MLSVQVLRLRHMPCTLIAVIERKRRPSVMAIIIDVIINWSTLVISLIDRAEKWKQLFCTIQYSTGSSAVVINNCIDSKELMLPVSLYLSIIIVRRLQCWVKSYTIRDFEPNLPSHIIVFGKLQNCVSRNTFTMPQSYTHDHKMQLWGQIHSVRFIDITSSYPWQTDHKMLTLLYQAFHSSDQTMFSVSIDAYLIGFDK